MSVINQMLKDLEQRAPEPGQEPVTIVTPQKPATLKIVLISTVILLSLNALGLYIWHLQERVAKSVKLQEHGQQLQALAQKLPVPSPVPSIKHQEQTSPLPTKPDKLLDKNKPTQAMSKKEDVVHTLPSRTNKNAKSTVKAVESVAKAKVSEVAKDPIESDIVKAPEPTPAKMSVSRRQLTSKELIAQKSARAEKALNINEITRAEQLFEEILIIEPKNKQARKKLAALWFGRKSYQQALNLLSQGIAIDKQDGELRLLKARIHLQKGQHEAAYNTLVPLASFENEEYQVTIANIAQQIEEYSSAVSAYQLLIEMQPYSGRWHLGLAIVYDKTSQFPYAINEYALALTKTDLSASSAKFAQQRMQAIGE